MPERAHLGGSSQQRKLEAGPPNASDCRDDAQGSPGPHRLGLALDPMRTGVLVCDRLGCDCPGYVIDQHGPWLGDGLDPEAVLMASPMTMPWSTAANSTAA